MTQLQRFRLPDMGEGLVEAEIVRWQVAVGEEVAVNDVLGEIETAKSLVELVSPFAGIVRELLAREGESVRVGTEIATVEAVGADRVGAAPVRAAPPARKMAKDLGIDLSTVIGSGAGGVIVGADVLERHRSTEAEAEAEAEGWPGPAEMAASQRVPVRGVRRATAAAMSASAFTAPHVTVFTTVDVTRSVKLLKRIKGQPAFAEARVTMLLLVARAVLLAAREFRILNATFDDAADEIVLHPRVNLGIATDSQRGLLVPNIKDAGALTLPDLALALTELVDVTRADRVPPVQLTGGTLTVTNIGVFGVDAGTPILNPGESAIVCLGAVRRTPTEHKGRIALRWTTQLAMSFDHRLIDGSSGSKALARIGQILSDPARELLLA